tara:strand:- start:109 stop:240 length:132 start_codon:yes stop_codon:yes gene_type:complete
MGREILIVVYGVVAACFSLLMNGINNAPIGYQDENGFHYGEPE